MASHSSGRNYITNKNHRLILANWNVRTLLDGANTDRPRRRTALITRELDRYKVDIAALSETRLSDTGSVEEVGSGYTVFWSGLPREERRVHGVGIAVRTALLNRMEQHPVAHGERLMAWRLPLSDARYVTLVSAYAPTLDSSEEIKEAFYERLHEVLRGTHRDDKLILMGDFNARVGRNVHEWEGVLGRHGVGKCNSNGLKLLTLCSEHQLTITNTRFQLKQAHKTTWMHPRSKHWHQLDHTIVRQRDVSDVKITKVMRGACGDTDHCMVRSIMRLRLKPRQRRQAPVPRLNVTSLRDANARRALREELQERLSVTVDDSADEEMLTAEWERLTNVILQGAEAVLGTRSRRNRDWFDENDEEIKVLLDERNRLHAAALNGRSPHARDRYKEARASVQRRLRTMENTWWASLAGEMQGYADTANQQEFYSALKTAYGPVYRAPTPVRSSDGGTLITDREGILNRWADHYRSLLNKQNATDESMLDDIEAAPTLWEIDAPPTVEEARAALNGLRNNKAAGPDCLPAEVLKYGGEAVVESLHELFSVIWRRGIVPRQWKNANIISIYKKKGDCAVCDNSRGISLLSVAGKVLARIMLMRLLECVAEDVLPESQCGFRRQRSTVDMIFVARQLQEKCREQNRDLFVVFIDLTKAFDTVQRPMLWSVLEKFGCPPNFLAVLRALHDGAMASVVLPSGKSDEFPVTAGVRQGCVLAPVIFNLFLAAVMRIAKRGVDDEDCFRIRYRLDGSLFNLRRLKARTRTQETSVFDLQYADDAALAGTTRNGLQHSLDCVAGTYARAGLSINTDKTEVLAQLQDPRAYEELSVNGQELSNVSQFKYLGSILTDSCELDGEVKRRVGLAAASFGKLSTRVFFNRNLNLDTKIKVYSAICVSILLYGSEAWAPYRRHIRVLEAFHTRCLKRMMGLKWWDRITHVEIRRRAKIDPIECILAQRHLRWVGHVHRMPEYRLPRRVLYGELAVGDRAVGGPRKRFKDHISRTMKKCNMIPSNLEAVAENRDAWRAACREGVECYATEYARAAEERRRRRHQTEVAGPTHACNQCGRMCASRIGLHSHLASHQRQRDNPQPQGRGRRLRR